ncbi:MAG: ThuA domain-containing protein [Candidatus Methylacidiphilales bacterium]|nr:ThuA domain-containing protein [Candidatus Methylacidiphilales bacterium]
MKRKALILAGGWPGHHPESIADLFQADLATAGFNVQVEKSLDPLADASLPTYDLIFPCWTMGQLTDVQSKGLQAAVRSGSGLGGIHGGMGDAFRGNLDYEWMVGGHFVGHPHVGDYTVRLRVIGDEITEGMPEEFPYRSEQYYMMVDPGIRVLAETVYTYEGHTCAMPVVWTKQWGAGRVFYNALGHDPKEFLDHPHVRQMTVRGLLWAARS